MGDIEIGKEVKITETYFVKELDGEFATLESVSSSLPHKVVRIHIAKLKLVS